MQLSQVWHNDTKTAAVGCSNGLLEVSKTLRNVSAKPGSLDFPTGMSAKSQGFQNTPSQGVWSLEKVNKRTQQFVHRCGWVVFKRPRSNAVARGQPAPTQNSLLSHMGVLFEGNLFGVVSWEAHRKAPNLQARFQAFWGYG